MKIIIIGAGNVGFHLAYALNELIGVDVVQIYSRTLAKAQSCAQRINAEYTNSLEKIRKDADLYILAVRDAAIAKVAETLSQSAVLKGKLVAHTSGATSSAAVASFFERWAVFYPLQTFSRDREVDFSLIPFCIDAAQEADALFLEKLAQQVSSKVARINDRERGVLHVAAVFVNNFTNYLYFAGEKITERGGVDFDLLKPLIAETAAKIKENTPYSMQTGPAVRRDLPTINKHLTFLEKQKDLQFIYQSLTTEIEKIHPTAAILPSAQPFLKQLFVEVKNANADFSDYEIDHICYRVESEERYTELKEKLMSYGDLLTEKPIGGRPIATFRLYEPIVFHNQKIYLLELPAPKLGSSYVEGFEHIEMVIDVDFQSLMQKYAHLTFDTKSANKKVNPEVRLTFASGSIKFHHHPLDYVIEYLD